MHQVLKKDKLDKNDFISWVAFHTQLQGNNIHPKAKIAVMPLFQEQVLSVAMICHAMNIEYPQISE